MNSQNFLKFVLTKILKIVIFLNFPIKYSKQFFLRMFSKKFSYKKSDTTFLRS